MGGYVRFLGQQTRGLPKWLTTEPDTQDQSTPAATATVRAIFWAPDEGTLGWVQPVSVVEHLRTSVGAPLFVHLRDAWRANTLTRLWAALDQVKGARGPVVGFQVLWAGVEQEPPTRSLRIRVLFAGTTVTPLAVPVAHVATSLARHLVTGTAHWCRLQAPVTVHFPRGEHQQLVSASVTRQNLHLPPWVYPHWPRPPIDSARRWLARIQASLPHGDCLLLSKVDCSLAVMPRKTAQTLLAGISLDSATAEECNRVARQLWQAATAIGGPKIPPDQVLAFEQQPDGGAWKLLAAHPVHPLHLLPPCGFTLETGV